MEKIISYFRLLLIGADPACSLSYFHYDHAFIYDVSEELANNCYAISFIFSNLRIFGCWKWLNIFNIFCSFQIFIFNNKISSGVIIYLLSLIELVYYQVLASKLLSLNSVFQQFCCSFGIIVYIEFYWNIYLTRTKREALQVNQSKVMNAF